MIPFAAAVTTGASCWKACSARPRIRALRFSQVIRPGRDLRSKRKQVSGCPLKFFPVASQKGELRPIADEFAGPCQPKTSESTGDHYDFVSQRIAEQQNYRQCASGVDNVTRFYHYRHSSIYFCPSV